MVEERCLAGEEADFKAVNAANVSIEAILVQYSTTIAAAEKGGFPQTP